MDGKSFSIRQALVYAGSTFKRNLAFFFLVWAVGGLLFLGSLFVALGINFAFLRAAFPYVLPIQGIFEDHFSYEQATVDIQRAEELLMLIVRYGALLIAGFLLVVLTTWVLRLGWTKLMLELHDTGKSTVKTLFCCFSLLGRYSIATFLYCLLVVVGLSLLLFPGIILFLRLGFYHYFIVDKKMGPINSLKQSWRLTRGNAWNLFGLTIIIVLIGFALRLVLHLAISLISLGVGFGFGAGMNFFAAKTLPTHVLVFIIVGRGLVFTTSWFITFFLGQLTHVFIYRWLQQETKKPKVTAADSMPKPYV